MASSHLKELIRRRPELAPCKASIADAFAALRACFLSGCKVLLCGNGGSAADADHWSAELLKGFCRERPLSAKLRKGLPRDISRHIQGALPAIPLSSFPALSSAFANDVSPELTFAQLVAALGRRGDTLIALSTSGNSRNVCLAAQTARARGMLTIALTGRGGGRLAKLADIAVRVPARETHLVQELHLPVYHCLSLMLEDAFFD
ncbi:MAG TPA: SIS domain-containing protein [Opitutaceae bacterium]